jgi:hypothetical protein
MFTDEELIEWIEHFGRGNVQELVAKRQDMLDVITYLRAERNLELAKGMAFVTGDLASFEKKTSSVLIAQGPELCIEQR